MKDNTISAGSTKTKRLTLIGLSAALLCILGPLSIPLPVSPVPITLTNFAVYIIIYILGMHSGTVSVLIYLCERFPGKNTVAVFGMILGLAVCYLFGTIWLARQMSLTFTAALGVGVLPYLPGDAVKIILAAVAGPKLRAAVKRI